MKTNKGISEQDSQSIENFLEEQYLKSLDIGIQGEQPKQISFDTKQEQTPFEILQLQESILKNPEQYQKITIKENDKLTGIIDNTELLKTKTNIESIESELFPETQKKPSPLDEIKAKLEAKLAQIQQIELVTQEIKTTQELIKKYQQLEQTYDKKLSELSDTLDKTLGIPSLKTAEQQQKTSKIPKEVFSEIVKHKSNPLKKIKDKLLPNLTKKTKLTPIKEQQLNNEIFNKARLKENILKPFQNANAKQNPEQIANEILSLLLDPIKRIADIKQKPELLKKPDPKTPPIMIEVDKKPYQLLSISKDKKHLYIQDENKKSYQVLADRNFKISLNPDTLNLTASQKEILGKNKTLLFNHGPNKLPITLKKNKDELEISTATTTQVLSQSKTVDKKQQAKTNSIKI